MTTQSFSPEAGLDDVYVARSKKLNCTAFRLRDGGLCLYSPVAGLETSGRDSLKDLGGVAAMLAPNHYHNKGLKGHRDAFPDASLTCSKTAEPRLKKITGLAFDPLDDLVSRLAENQEILEPEGLRTGEVWVKIETGSELVWIVSDAFSATLHPPGVDAVAPSMLGTFPRYGIRDGSIYKDWVIEQVKASAPTVLLTCHGSPVKSRNLGRQLVDLLHDAF